MTNSSVSHVSFLIDVLIVRGSRGLFGERFTRLQDEILVLYHIRECHIFLQMEENFRMHHSVIVFPTFFNVTINVNAFNIVTKFMRRTVSEML